MTWRIDIVHRNTYRYARPAVGSYNEVRMTPANGERQRLLDRRLQVSPHASLMHYRDYWGTAVDAFDVHTPHLELSIVSSSTVETSPPLNRRLPCTWDDLARRSVTDTWAEFLAPTDYTELDESHLPLAVELRGAADDGPEVVARRITDWVRSSMSYQPGSTRVSSPAADSLRSMAGVCQDFAHVTIAIARRLGIASRYVSGYLHPDADAELGQVVAGQSHAWVEFWLGEWKAFDPTNGAAVGERHVLVGRGRDYGDVSPLRGVYQGTSGATLDVSVQLTRTA